MKQVLASGRQVWDGHPTLAWLGSSFRVCSRASRKLCRPGIAFFLVPAAHFLPILSPLLALAAAPELHHGRCRAQDPHSGRARLECGYPPAGRARSQTSQSLLLSPHVCHGKGKLTGIQHRLKSPRASSMPSSTSSSKSRTLPSDYHVRTREISILHEKGRSSV